MWACSGVDLDTVKYRNISYSYTKSETRYLGGSASKTATVPTAMPLARHTLNMYFVSGTSGKQCSACGLKLNP